MIGRARLAPSRVAMWRPEPRPIDAPVLPDPVSNSFHRNELWIELGRQKAPGCFRSVGLGSAGRR